jgi:hypothetical protein
MMLPSNYNPTPGTTPFPFAVKRFQHSSARLLIFSSIFIAYSSLLLSNLSQEFSNGWMYIQVFISYMYHTFPLSLFYLLVFLETKMEHRNFRKKGNRSNQTQFLFRAISNIGDTKEINLASPLLSSLFL